MIEKITENLNVIEELPDKPTISSTELKRKFDFAGNTIKNFINTKLIPILETMFSKKGGTVEGNLNVNGNLQVVGTTKLTSIDASGNITTAADITGNNINATNINTTKIDTTTLNVKGDATFLGDNKVTKSIIADSSKIAKDLTVGRNIVVTGNITKGGVTIPTIKCGVAAPNVSQMEEGEIYLQVK